MTALVAKADISGTPSRATSNAGFGNLWEFVDERFATGDGTAAEKAATRTALEAARGLQSIDGTVGTNALTLTLNPTNIEFRSATITSGAVVMRTVAAAITTVISSGSTGGTQSGVPSRIAALAIDNAGTVELAWVNADGGFHFDESQLISTTAEGGAGGADSASVVYSTTARSSVAFRFVGYVESTQATAGTWATTPSKKQPAGGMADLRIALHAQVGVPIFATAAWVNFNGTGTVAIRASGNVSSITDNGSGDYTVNFTNAMPDANYSASVTAGGTAGITSGTTLDQTTPRTTSALRIASLNASHAASDAAYVEVHICR